MLGFYPLSSEPLSGQQATGGGSAVSGTLAWTEENEAISASVALQVNVAASWAEQNETSAVSVALEVNASVAWTEDGESIAIAATSGDTVATSLSWAEANDAQAIGASVAVNLSASWTEANDAQSIAGSVGNAISATVAWTEAADSQSLDGTVTQPNNAALIWTEQDEQQAISANRGGASNDEPVSYAPTERKPRKQKDREKRLGGQYVQLEPAKVADAIAQPAKQDTFDAQAKQQFAEQAEKLDVLAGQIAQQLAQNMADAAQYAQLAAEQARIKQEQDSLATLIAYEALMKRLEAEEIEMLLLCL